MRHLMSIYAACFFLLAIVVIVYQYTNRLELGTDLTTASDEGFYMDAAFKYYLGDNPIKDEIFTTTRGFDYYLGFLFKKIGPNDVLFWRKISLAHFAFILLFSLLLLIRAFGIKDRRFSLIIIPLTLFVYCNLWTLSYVNLMPLILLASYSLLISSSYSNNKIIKTMLIALAALIVSTLLIIYTPMYAIVFSVPMISFILKSLCRDEPNIQSISNTLNTYFFLSIFSGAIIVTFFCAKGLCSTFIENINEIKSLSQYSGNRFVILLKKILFHNKAYLSIFLTLVGGLIGFFSSSLINKKSIYLILSVISLVSLFFIIETYLSIDQFFSIYNGMGRFNLFLIAFSIGTMISEIRNKTFNSESILFSFLITSTIGAIFIILTVSANGFFHLNNLTWLIWIFNLLYVWRFSEKNKITLYKKIGNLFLVTMLILSGCHFSWIYFDKPIKNLTYTLKSERLNGIKTDPDKGFFIDQLIEEVTKITSPESYVLFFDNIGYGNPGSRTLYGFNYLTNTRPPLKATILQPETPNNEIAAKWLKKMLHEKKDPIIAVTTALIKFPNTSIEDYILKNFSIYKSQSNFVIYINHNHD